MRPDHRFPSDTTALRQRLDKLIALLQALLEKKKP